MRQQQQQTKVGTIRTDKPLNHVRQKGPTCVVATLAMISGKPYEELMKDARKIAPKGWTGNFVDNCLLYEKHGFDYKSLSTSSDPVATEGQVKRPKLAGRGTLLVKWKYERSGHIMAFDKGLIYDGNCNHGNGETWNEWLENLPTRYGYEANLSTFKAIKATRLFN